MSLSVLAGRQWLLLSSLGRHLASNGPRSGGNVGAAAMDQMNNDAEPKESKGVEKCINTVTLLGRVGVDPQLRGTDEHPVVAFSLATNLRYKPGGPDSGNDYVTKTDWHNVAVFRPYLRDTVHQNVVKGQRVLVQGRIMYGTVEDKMGNIRHTTTIVADDVVRFN